MKNKLVKDLMVPLDDYALVSHEASLYDAILALDEAQKSLPPGRQPYRAVLVADDEGKIVGKIGQIAFLNALEPKYNALGDVGKLSRAGVSPEFIASMMDHFQFFQDNLSDICRRATTIKASDAMRPATDCISENAALGDALHQIVMLQTLSLLVTRGDEVVGLLRLSDLFEEITREIKKLSK